MSRRAALYLFGDSDPRSAVEAWLRKKRYRPWPALPTGYQRVPHEVREFVYRAPQSGDTPTWGVLIPEAFEEVFAFALALSQAPAHLTVFALTDTWDGRVRAKLYRDGKVLLKVGDDRDDELTYFIPKSEARQFEESARALGLPSGAAGTLPRWGAALGRGDVPSLDEAVYALGLPEPPRRFADARKAAERAPGAPYDHLLYLDARSPLVLNA